MTRARYGEGAQIVCDGLVRIFKVADLEVVALQGLDLLVAAGEMMAIVGASGSGKSTLLNILGGLDTPSAGRASVAGHDLTQLGRRERTAYRRRVVGVVWQQTARNLLPYLSAAENVELPMVLEGRKGRARPRPRAARDGRAVGRAGHRPDRLSGGEQQRVAIAVALANAPEVILADEPTGELDSATSAEIFGVLRAVNADLGTTVRGGDPRPARIRARSPDDPDPGRPDEHRDGPPDRARGRRRPPGHRRGVRPPRPGRTSAAAARPHREARARGAGPAPPRGRSRRRLAGSRARDERLARRPVRRAPPTGGVARPIRPNDPGETGR